ncbi:hypothetical protein FRC14_004736 [Serendipita sp. 396]|nr:hypothetical protein FRC14_004736 [Serendipita sp. 396]KAG8789383.1 hypothetical protein FRC15_009435 [Serendipita sp. 397]KAG8878737.1 hypothetical protein FRC20_006414 [Serendipita sp. 405]
MFSGQEGLSQPRLWGSPKVRPTAEVARQCHNLAISVSERIWMPDTFVEGQVRAWSQSRTQLDLTAPEDSSMTSVEVKQARRGSYEYEDISRSSSATAGERSHPNSAFQPQRTRVISNPGAGNGPIPHSAGPYRTSFNVGLPNGSPNHTRSGSSSSFASQRSDGTGVPSRPSFSVAAAPGQGSPPPFGPYGAHTRSTSSTSDLAINQPFRSAFSSISEDGPISDLSAPGQSVVNGTGDPSQQQSQLPQPAQSSMSSPRRHARIHSRNLSIYFPRPGSTAVPAIAEDGSQEIEAPVADISSTTPTPMTGRSRYSHSSNPHSATSPPPRSQFGGGFKFGGKPPLSASSTHNSVSSIGSVDSSGEMTRDSTSTSDQGPSSVPMSKAGTAQTGLTQNTTSSRRGHHHRHSLSHSFFSFLEPGSTPNPSPGYNQHRRNPSSGLSVTVTSPPPTSTAPSSAVSQVSGWGPLTPFSTTATAFPPAQILPPKRTASFHASSLPNPSTQRSSSLMSKLLTLPNRMRNGLVLGVVECLIGCALWVIAQHVESLACAGLAYWVVFDALGAILGIYGKLIDSGAGLGSLKQPYGAKRVETVALFAQSVYLLFAAVYICKETLEHALLSADDAGHHHHHSPGGAANSGSGPSYPATLLWLSFISLSLSATLLKSNIKVLDATGLYIPSFRQALRSLSSSSTFVTNYRPSSAVILLNPYNLFPLACTLLLLSISTLPMTNESQRAADMLVAGLEALGTAWLAWPACFVFGKVLLQTAPERSSDTKETLTAAKGTMEALLRAMKEIERHPQVLHLPAPHVWQLSPPSKYFKMTEGQSSVRGGNHKLDDDDDENGGGDLRKNGSANGHVGVISQSFTNSRVRTRPTHPASGGQIIVTLELHVRKDLEDVECLELTRWAWQRCISALGQGDEGVSVGIIRG